MTICSYMAFPSASFISSSLQIVHGDLKAVHPMRNRAILLYLILNGLLFQLNVLIDDSGKSVLFDFSLSRVTANATGRIAR